MRNMDHQEGFSPNRAPLFDGTNYAFWSIRIRTYLMEVGFDIWKFLVIGYIVPTTPPIDTNGKKLSECNVKCMNSILCGLEESEFVKVMHCETRK